MSDPGSHGPVAHYLLGHSEDELRRLDLQGALYRPFTERAFREAGIGPGSRVLDIGCGSGDVSMLVGRLVGTDGAVVGIDRGPEAIRAARERAGTEGAQHVRFEQHEIDEYACDEPFDAAVGRFVLMHQTDPARTLRAVAANVRPGGVVVMIESYMEMLRTGAHSEPTVPLYQTIVDFKCRVVSGAGADLRAGGRLRQIFLAAGLPDPTIHLEARLEGGADSIYYEYVEQSVRSMLPEAARHGLRAFDGASVDGLAERLREETTSRDASLVVWPVASATARLHRAGGPSA